MEAVFEKGEGEEDEGRKLRKRELPAHKLTLGGPGKGVELRITFKEEGSPDQIREPRREP